MKLTGIDLNLLLAFEALLEERSVTAAARRLAIGQSGMSAALGRLRDLLGDELFVRGGGLMHPTAKALQMGPGITTALRQLRQTLEDGVGFNPATARRRLRIGGSDTIAQVLLPRLMARLRREAPEIDLQFIGYEKGEVAAMLDRGELDIATGVFPHPPDRTVATRLFEERFIAVARTGHPAIHDGQIDVRSFAALPHALITTRRDLTGAIDEALAQLGLKRRIALTVPYAMALPAILGTTDLVAALPQRLADPILQGAGLQRFELPITLAPWTVTMLWHVSTRNDPALAWLRQIVVQEGQEVRVPG